MTDTQDLDGARDRAEAFMRATCTIVRPSSTAPTLNRTTGALTVPAGETIYTGVCGVQAGPGMGTLTRVEGGEDTAVRSWLLRLPFDDDAHQVRRGDVVTITESDNAQLVDHPIVVHAPDLRARQVTIKLVCTERSYEQTT